MDIFHRVKILTMKQKYLRRSWQEWVVGAMEQKSQVEKEELDQMLSDLRREKQLDKLSSLEGRRKKSLRSLVLSARYKYFSTAFRIWDKHTSMLMQLFRASSKNAAGTA